MVGADATKPELRAPSIKGAMRFWWRAMNGHLPLSELRRQEAEIFGDTSKRSKIIIQVIEEPEVVVENFLLPHKNSSPSASFTTGEMCQIKLSLPREPKGFTLDHLKHLFILTCLLGGFGKRSRRGMGSIGITKIEDKERNVLPFSNSDVLKQIEGSLKFFSHHYKTQYEGVFNTFNGRMELYPWIKSIQVGKKTYTSKEISALLVRVGKTTHDFKHIDNLAYEASLGHATKGRFASPIYVSVIETSTGLSPIITTLNTCPGRAFHDISKMMQEDFKNAILL
jgi:CRISPR-associated protein Cmr1